MGDKAPVTGLVALALARQRQERREREAYERGYQRGRADGALEAVAVLFDLDGHECSFTRSLERPDVEA